jgi:hypothetical protein
MQLFRAAFLCALAAIWTIGMMAASARVGAAGAQQAAAAGDVSSQQALLNQYCVGCHNSRQQAQGRTPVALDALEVTNVPAHAEQWEKVIVKVRAGLMPPSGCRDPRRRGWMASCRGWRGKSIAPPRRAPTRVVPSRSTG